MKAVALLCILVLEPGKLFLGTWVFYAAPQPLFGPSMLAHSPAGPAEPF